MSAPWSPDSSAMSGKSWRDFSHTDMICFSMALKSISSSHAGEEPYRKMEALLGGELPTNRKWVSSPQWLMWINPTKIPFITGVISHLLSGMSHQVLENPWKWSIHEVYSIIHGKTAIFHGYVKWQRGYINRKSELWGIWESAQCRLATTITVGAIPYFWTLRISHGTQRCCHFQPKNHLPKHKNLEVWRQIAWKIQWS